MNPEQQNIAELIPQRAPFVMVDRLTAADEHQIVSLMVVREDNIFLENNQLREFGLIENIAQTTTAGIAWNHMQKNDNNSSKASAEGFLGGISKLKIHQLPKLHDTVETFVTPVAQFENMYLVKGETRSNGKLLLECEMKLASTR